HTLAFTIVLTPALSYLTSDCFDSGNNLTYTNCLDDSANLTSSRVVYDSRGNLT
ncbi:hypothetical protein PanWU01x14_131480, partial [Parasponia andersonii]